MPGKSTIKHKTCRALGVNLIGSPRAALTLSKRPNRPGQHGANRRQKISPFGEQLQETQKLKYFYGVSAKQLRRYYKKASMSRMQTNIALVQQLETRLDNMVYRMGFAGTLRAARQMVVHRHLMVNGKSVNKPGYQVNPGDVVQQLNYISRDPAKMSASLVQLPEREEIPILVEDHLVVISQNPSLQIPLKHIPKSPCENFQADKTGIHLIFH